MAITRTNKAISGNISDLLTYNTSEQTPSPNQLQLIAVFGFRNGGAAPVPSLSGCGLTWDAIANITYNTIASPKTRVSLFRALGPNPTTGQVSITFSLSQSAVSWIWVEFDGIDTGGANGSGAIVQSALGRGNAESNLSIALGAFGHVNNATYAVFGALENAGVFTVNSPWTNVGGHTGTSVRDRAILRLDNDTTADIGLDAQNWGGVAVEIKAAAVAGDVLGSIAGNVPKQTSSLSGTVGATVPPIRSERFQQHTLTAIHRASRW